MTTDNEDLSKLQAELARCLTGRGVSPKDSHVTGLSKLDLDLSRETLIRKRLSQTRNLLPRTAAWMGPQFAEQFREFAETHHFNGEYAISKEAVFFSNWLVTRKLAYPWIGQLAQWESMECHWSLGRISVRILRSEYDFTLRSRLNEAPPKRVQMWCFIRCFTWWRKIRVWPIVFTTR